MQLLLKNREAIEHGNHAFKVRRLFVVALYTRFVLRYPVYCDYKNEEEYRNHPPNRKGSVVPSTDANATCTKITLEQGQFV